jgi:hypothetical protein
MTPIRNRSARPCIPALPSYSNLLHLSDAELGAMDTAVVNLACAVGLPGWEAMDVARCITTLNDAAVWVEEITAKSIRPEFHANPSQYEHNEPLFRMVKLVHVLQRCFRILYNPARIMPSGEPIRAHDEFIFGAIQGPGGTCATLPIVYTAVARRLGYPVRLVWTKSHAFCRWDDPLTGVKVNIEGTSHNGVNTYTDDHYRQWPKTLGQEEEEFFGYLKSLSPREELASFLEARSIVWMGVGDFAQALDCLYSASDIDLHQHKRYQAKFFETAKWWLKRLSTQGKIGKRYWAPKHPTDTRRWPNIPWAWEAEILTLQAAENGTNPRGWRRRWDDSASDYA